MTALNDATLYLLILCFEQLAEHVQTAQQREHSAHTSLQQAVHESDAALALAALGTHTAVATAAAAARAAASAELQSELLTAQRSADRMATASEVCTCLQFLHDRTLQLFLSSRQQLIHNQLVTV